MRDLYGRVLSRNDFVSVHRSKGAPRAPIVMLLSDISLSDPNDDDDMNSRLKDENTHNLS